METKEFKIEVPQGYEIDKENSTFEKIVFKKVEEKITWEDCTEGIHDGWGITSSGEVYNTNIIYPFIFKNRITAKAVLALAQLEWLRDEYIRRYYPENPNWKPNWGKSNHYVISNYSNKIKSVIFSDINSFLVFPTLEIRDKFLEDHRSLIEQVKPLL